MSRQEPKGIHADGSFGGEGSTIGTQYFNPNKDEVKALSDKIREMSAVKSSFRAIATVTAYFDHVELEMTKRFKDEIIDPDTKSPKHAPIDDNITYDMRKYMVLLLNLALVGLVDGIESSVEYLRLSEDGSSFFHYIKEPTQDNIRLDKNVPGRIYVTDILKKLAERIDPNLEAKFKAPKIKNERLLAVIRLNGIKVAYYSANNEGIMIYPFNTSLCNQIPEYSLLGMEVVNYNDNTSNINYVKYDLEKALSVFNPPAGAAEHDPRFDTPDKRKRIASNVIETLKMFSTLLDQQNRKGFNWLIQELKSYFPDIADSYDKIVLIDAPEYAYRDFEAITAPAQPDELQVPIGDRYYKFKQALPYEKDKVTVYYCNEINANHDAALIVKSDDSTYSFSYDGKELPEYPEGLIISQLPANTTKIILSTRVRGHDTGEVVFDLVSIPESFFVDDEKGEISHISEFDVRGEKHSKITLFDIFNKDLFLTFENKIACWPVNADCLELLYATGHTFSIPNVSISLDDNQQIQPVEVVLNIDPNTPQQKRLSKTYDYDAGNIIRMRKISAVHYTKTDLLVVSSDDANLSFSFKKNAIPAYPYGLESISNYFSKVNESDKIILEVTDRNGKYNGSFLFDLRKDNSEILFSDNDNSFIEVMSDRLDITPVFTEKLFLSGVLAKLAGNAQAGNAKLEIIPVTAAFVDKIKAKKLQISVVNASANFEIDMGIKLSDAEIKINLQNSKGAILHSYSKNYNTDEKRLKEFPCANGDNRIEDYTRDMPEISIYPYMRRRINGENVISNYYWTALREESDDRDKYAFLSKLEIKSFSAEDGDNYVSFGSNMLCYLKRGRNPFMAAQTTNIPDALYFTYKVGNTAIELGYMQMPIPDDQALDATKTSKAAFDMGSRNSIMALKIEGDPDPEPYYLFDLNLRRVIISSSLRDDSSEKMIVGVQCMDIKNSFVSSYMIPYIVSYDQIGQLQVKDSIKDELNSAEPMVFRSGRIIANTSAKLYNDLLDTAIDNDPEGKDPLNFINVISDFKRKLLIDVKNKKPLDPKVFHFIAECIYHMILNSLYYNAQRIQLCFSSPDEETNNQLKDIWDRAMRLVVNYEYTGNLNVDVIDPITEAEALYNTIKDGWTNGVGAPQSHNIIIDGGDSTFDVSLINQENVENEAGIQLATSLDDHYSINYAGNRIIIKSIAEVCQKLSANLEGHKLDKFKTDFTNIWGGGKLGVGDRAFTREQLAQIQNYVKNYIDNKLFKNLPVNWKSENTYQTLYRIIENPHNLPFVRNEMIPVSEKIARMIEIKYLFTLYITFVRCITHINDDREVSINLYGGTNNVGQNILWSDNFEATLQKFAEKMFISFGKSNPITIKIASINTMQKYDLVKGLTLGDGAAHVASASGGAASDSVKDDPKKNNEEVDGAETFKPTDTVDFTVDFTKINTIIETIFDRELFPYYWDGDTCILCCQDIEEIVKKLSDKNYRYTDYAMAYSRLLDLRDIEDGYKLINSNDDNTNFFMFILSKVVDNYLNSLC